VFAAADRTPAPGEASSAAPNFVRRAKDIVWWRQTVFVEGESNFVGSESNFCDGEDSSAAKNCLRRRKNPWPRAKPSSLGDEVCKAGVKSGFFVQGVVAGRTALPAGRRTRWRPHKQKAPVARRFFVLQ
jgi:hypothetical protein